MALVVFFRAVNVGGHQTFQPSQLARSLAEYNVVSIGAAGTFVIKGKATEAQLRKAIAKVLPFAPEIMVVDGTEVKSLLQVKAMSEPEDGIGRFLTIISKPLASKPRLPISAPDSDDWQVRIVALKGVCVMSLRRPGGKRQLYPNEIVEKTFNTSATTRNWATVQKVCDALAK
jgi:uncharacterized protein (DUF1697 family)